MLHLTASDLLHTTALDGVPFVLFNSFPKSLRNITDVDILVSVFKLDYFLKTLRHSPTELVSDNNVNRRIEEASQLILWRASDVDLVWSSDVDLVR